MDFFAIHVCWVVKVVIGTVSMAYERNCDLRNNEILNFVNIYFVEASYVEDSKFFN